MTPNIQLAERVFRRMNGLGNEFVVLDLRDEPKARLTGEQARAIADKTIGPGCDQVITIEIRQGTTFMGVYNADGSEVGACGNAARCVADILMRETGASHTNFRTLSQSLSAERAGDWIAVDMGAPKYHWTEIPLSEQMDDTRYVDIKLGPIDAPVLWGPSAVNIGNPHCVFFVDDAEAQQLDRFGPLIENHPLFPERANVSVAEVRSRENIRLRVWERGAGLTKACGTAACAALVCAHRRRLTNREATIILDGGALKVRWNDEDRVILTGPIEYEYNGVLSREVDAAAFQPKAS